MSHKCVHTHFLDFLLHQKKNYQNKDVHFGITYNCEKIKNNLDVQP